jgi:competence protein ComEA
VAGAGAAPGAVVDLNTADATQLDALPGIGPATAAKIVADRQANGPFRTADDLGRVSGIGPKKLDQLKPLICVR